MLLLDDTQRILDSYLQESEIILNNLLLEKFNNKGCKIIPCLDLGFPHDVIRLAGGFATGMYITWFERATFVPIDICMNVCSVSIYELKKGDIELVTQKAIEKLLDNLSKSSYIANFHRGNHFISYAESINNQKKYIIIHSSAAEFETYYNGLYPVENNYFYSRIKTFYSRNRYIRYIDGNTAELFYALAENLYAYNERRHDFIIASLIDERDEVTKKKHYHHYGMPNRNEALLGCHKIRKGDETPLLTRPGENIYLIKYFDAKPEYRLDDEFFITPHGLGKCHIQEPHFSVNITDSNMTFDGLEYSIKYGSSLRNHPGLKLRDMPVSNYFSFFDNVYKYEIIDEFRQISSYNKLGYRKW